MVFGGVKALPRRVIFPLHCDTHYHQFLKYSLPREGAAAVGFVIWSQQMLARSYSAYAVRSHSQFVAAGWTG